MKEADARRWLPDHLHVPRETLEDLERYIALVSAANVQQNLIASSTIASLWGRHIVDSAQLVPHLGKDRLIDIGSGAGFPGMVIAIVTRRPIILVEPRRKRAEFLTATAATLGLTVVVRQSRIESVVAPPAGTIVARAVASLDTLFAAAIHLSDAHTRWILPKGRSVESELAAARETWQGDFTVVPSITEPAAAIVVAERVRRKARR